MWVSGSQITPLYACSDIAFYNFLFLFFGSMNFSLPVKKILLLGETQQGHVEILRFVRSNPIMTNNQFVLKKFLILRVRLATVHARNFLPFFRVMMDFVFLDRR